MRHRGTSFSFTVPARVSTLDADSRRRGRLFLECRPTTPTVPAAMGRRPPVVGPVHLPTWRGQMTTVDPFLRQGRRTNVGLDKGAVSGGTHRGSYPSLRPSPAGAAGRSGADPAVHGALYNYDWPNGRHYHFFAPAQFRPAPASGSSRCRPDADVIGQRVAPRGTKASEPSIRKTRRSPSTRPARPNSSSSASTSSGV